MDLIFELKCSMIRVTKVLASISLNSLALWLLFCTLIRVSVSTVILTPKIVWEDGTPWGPSTEISDSATKCGPCCSNIPLNAGNCLFHNGGFLEDLNGGCRECHRMNTAWNYGSKSLWEVRWEIWFSQQLHWAMGNKTNRVIIFRNSVLVSHFVRFFQPWK